jgi:tetratricopeptide (TPR) repeat protein
MKGATMNRDVGRRSPAGHIAATVLMLWIQIGSLGVVPAVAQTPSKAPVVRGQEYYEQSRFDEAITLLRDLVDRGALAGDDLLKAREILARSYVKKGYPAQAKDMFKAILRTNPDYRPDPIRVPPDETAVFEQALKEYKSGAPATQPAPADTAKAAPPPAPVKMAPEAAVVPATKSTKKPLYKQWWVWLAGAAVVGGVAAAAAGGGGGGGGSTGPTGLSGFPGPPN